MSKANDPNFGCVGKGNGFEEWACDDFNLLEYVGQDSSPFDRPFVHDEFDSNEDDDSLRKKDMIYSTWQINNALLSHDQPIEPAYNDFYDSIPSQNPATFDDCFVSDNAMVPSTSKSSPLLSTKSVKHEIDHPAEFSRTGFESVYDYDNHIPIIQQHDGDTSYSLKNCKPRKYRIKPDSEKRNPYYRAKREKNNDAVRKSRDKAKRLQEEKDERLQFLEEEHVKQLKLIDQLQNRNQFLEAQLLNIKRACTCQHMPTR